MRKKRFIHDLEPVEEPIINLTPLIDVVFVVLITFMLIAPILDIDSVDLAQSGPLEKKQLQPAPLCISVHADNTIWMQNTQISFKELEAKMRREFQKNPDAIPQLLHDQKAQFGTYQALKNMLESIGFAQLDVILKPG